MVCYAMFGLLHYFHADDFVGIERPGNLVPGGTCTWRFTFRAVRLITVPLGFVTTVNIISQSYAGIICDMGMFYYITRWPMVDAKFCY